MLVGLVGWMAGWYAFQMIILTNLNFIKEKTGKTTLDFYPRYYFFVLNVHAFHSEKFQLKNDSIFFFSPEF